MEGSGLSGLRSQLYRKWNDGPLSTLCRVPRVELPVVGSAPAERCDAQRNRRRILEAAERLFARRGVEAVSLDQIAEAAGVGKGTLFRRFGDRNGLVRALLSEREAAFQESLIRGAPPLGPGAPARERLLAFGPAYLAFVADHGDILAAAELGRDARHGAAPYVFLRTHVRHLLEEAAPSLDHEYLADALLAPLGARTVMHQLGARGMTLERLAGGWCALAEGCLAAR